MLYKRINKFKILDHINRNADSTFVPLLLCKKKILFQNNYYFNFLLYYLLYFFPLISFIILVFQYNIYYIFPTNIAYYINSGQQNLQMNK